MKSTKNSFVVCLFVWGIVFFLIDDSSIHLNHSFPSLHLSLIPPPHSFSLSWIHFPLCLFSKKIISLPLQFQGNSQIGENKIQEDKAKAPTPRLDKATQQEGKESPKSRQKSQKYKAHMDGLHHEGLDWPTRLPFSPRSNILTQSTSTSTHSTFKLLEQVKELIPQNQMSLLNRAGPMPMSRDPSSELLSLQPELLALLGKWVGVMMPKGYKPWECWGWRGVQQPGACMETVHRCSA